MMSLLRWTFATSLLALALGGCGDIRSADDPTGGDNRTAGNSTETENSAAARSILVDSVLDDRIRPYGVPTVATLRFDDSTFDFSQVDPEGRDIAFETSGGAPIPFHIVLWDKAMGKGILRVRIETAQLAAGSRILFRWGQELARRSDSAAVWSDIPGSLHDALTSVLVDDFEGGVLNNRLPDTSFWFIAALGSGTGLASAGDGRSGSALRLVIASVAGPNVLAATLLAPTPRSFRTMDSLVAWVRGTGKVRLALEHLGGSGMKRAYAMRELTGSWQRVSIRPQDFEPASDSVNVGWTAIRDSINYVTFGIEGGAELRVDDIRIHGLVRGDLK